MNHTTLRYKLQKLYYRLGGYSVTLGVCLSDPELVHTRHGEMYRTWLLQSTPDHIEKYPLYLIPDLFMKKYGGKFQEGRDVAVKGALYRDYGLVYDAFNY